MDGWKRRKTCTIQEIVLCCLFLESSPSCNPLLLLLSKSCLLLIYSSLWNVNPLREFLPCPCYKIVIIQFFVTHSWLFLTAICSNSLYFPPLPHRSKARVQVNILLPPARQPSSCKLRQLCQRWRKEFLWTKLICCSRKTLPQLFFFNHSSFSVHSSLVQENKSRAKGLESTWRHLKLSIIFNFSFFYFFKRGARIESQNKNNNNKTWMKNNNNIKPVHEAQGSRTRATVCWLAGWLSSSPLHDSVSDSHLLG